MSFKCSVFGHAYGDSEIERDREEEGSEVVTTIRELQTCKRCGETRVVSENKEVTTLETAADIVADDLEAETATETSADQPEGPAETVDAAEPAPEEAGATILDAESGEETTPQTESPDEGESVESVPQDVDPAADDGVILEEEEEEDNEPEREPGEWPEEPDSGDDDWKPETEIDPTPDDDPAVEPTESAVTVPEGEFQCPECGFTTPVEASSLRRGDFCPECHRGSLEHVTE